MPITETTIGNNYAEYLANRGIWEKEVNDETPEQRECAVTAIRMLNAYQSMRDAPDKNVKGQCAHDFLVYFKDLQKRHPSWISSVDRFLDRGEFKNANIKVWARQSFLVYRDWIHTQEAKKLEIEAKNKRDLENFNRKARGQE